MKEAAHDELTLEMQTTSLVQCDDPLSAVSLTRCSSTPQTNTNGVAWPSVRLCFSRNLEPPSRETFHVVIYKSSNARNQISAGPADQEIAERPGVEASSALPCSKSSILIQVLAGVEEAAGFTRGSVSSRHPCIPHHCGMQARRSK
jgi:hypothetical protein